MSHSAQIKATHKAIQTYYQALQACREHDVGHETALRSAFQNLLAEIAKTRHWLLVPGQSNRAGGKRVVPDGTLYDHNNLHRGYWEAKDTDDHLDAEIAKKIKKGYPLSNIIFEDTRQAVLFQGKREVLRVDLSQPKNVADLLNLFFDYTEPEIEDFAKAVEEFKDRVPDLAHGLADKIKTAHRDNPKFQTATGEWTSEALIGHALSHLSRYEGILMLRAIWERENKIDYQLVEIPLDLLRKMEGCQALPVKPSPGAKKPWLRRTGRGRDSVSCSFRRRRGRQMPAPRSAG